MFAFMAAMTSAIVLNLESVGTTTRLYSPVSRAIGVRSRSVTTDLLVAKDEIIPYPMTAMESLAPLDPEINFERPTAPAAPGTLSTWMELASPSFCKAACIERAVAS